MSLISNNLRFLRKKNHYTQEQMAEKIGIKRSLLGAYEEGRADPRLNNLLAMSKIFNVSVDALISKDLTHFDSLSMLQPSQKLKVLAITVDKENNEFIDLVPQRAAAGYLNGYADPEYLEELPKFKVPVLPLGHTYRAFEISGDSMLPIEPGSIIIGQYVENLDYIKNGHTYVLLTKREGVVYKRVYNQTHEKGKLYLVSDNSAYSPYEVDAEEVLEIWESKAFISTKFPRPANADSMTIEKLTAIVLDLQKEVARLKG